MEVFIPERRYANQPEIRAVAKFFREPSQFGIDSGRISKLTIQSRRTDLLAKAAGRPYETVNTLYNYDRGLDVDRLRPYPRARRLYEHVLRELG